MTSKSLCHWIRAAAVATAVCLLLFCIFLYPITVTLWHSEVITWPALWAWLILLWTVSVPLFAILVYVWKVAGMVKSETVFSDKVAGYVKNSALILFIDTGVLFAGGIVFAALQLASLLLPVVFIAAVVGFALAVAAAVLARYITKAAVLQEDSEGTI